VLALVVLQVLFHLQVSRPAVLPPLWQLFYSEPHVGARPLEQDAADQQNGSSSSSSTSSRRGRSSSNPRQQSCASESAPYHLLDVCAAQRQQIQPLYNGSSKASSSRPLLMLAGFIVRFREIFHQWCELGQHK
jgi:hypothetical protein